MADLLDDATQMRDRYLRWLRAQAEAVAQDAITRARVESRNLALAIQRETAPAQRVERAIDASGAKALQLVKDGFEGVELGPVISTVLLALAKDVALYVGGCLAVGAAVGAGVGSLAGGVGAIPGAAAGGAAGLAAAPWVLNLIGLACLADGLVKTLPDAFDYYERAFKLAWTEDKGSVGVSPVDAAAQEFAQGHLLLIAAILMAMAAYLMKGGLNKSKLLAEIGKSSRLGPKVVMWVEKNEASLVKSGGKLKTRNIQETGSDTPRSSQGPRKPTNNRLDNTSSKSSTDKEKRAGREEKAALKDPGAVKAPPSSRLPPEALPHPAGKKYNLPERDAPNFLDARPATLPEGTKLYRIVDDKAHVNGGYWSLEKPRSMAEWRGDYAVLSDWNKNGQYVSYEVPAGGLNVWRGTTSSQSLGGGYQLPGGKEQIFVPQARYEIPVDIKKLPTGW